MYNGKFSFGNDSENAYMALDRHNWLKYIHLHIHILRICVLWTHHIQYTFFAVSGSAFPIILGYRLKENYSNHCFFLNRVIFDLMGCIFKKHTLIFVLLKWIESNMQKPLKIWKTIDFTKRMTSVISISEILLIWSKNVFSFWAIAQFIFFLNCFCQLF